VLGSTIDRVPFVVTVGGVDRIDQPGDVTIGDNEDGR
jgi:hypothetical protein